MELITFLILFGVALCSAVEDTQEKDPVDLPRNIEDIMRRLTQQQLQASQNFEPGMLSQMNVPRMRNEPMDGGVPERVNSPFPLFKFPLQSTSGFGETGAHSYASSSVTVKRPNMGRGRANVEASAQASAFSSVRDVDDEENMGDRFSFDDRPSERASLDKSSAPVGYQKSTTIREEILGVTDEGGSTKKGEPVALKHQHFETIIKEEDSFSDVYFVAIVAGCCAVGIFGVISAGICFYKLQKSRKAAADVDYPAYGVTGPNKDISSPNGDRKLAQSAQMYHYQHQKQQMIAVEKAGSTKNTSASDVDSEEENEEGDYTVYECPGLAPTGEMEVKNPLFHDDSTPVSPPVINSKSDSNQNN